MKKNSIVIVMFMMLTFLGMPVEAQNGFNIPFSQYGIGQSDLPYNMPAAYGMGGVVYSRSANNRINPFNPASYAAIEMESFVFDIGVNIQSCVLRHDAESQTDADGNVAYITVAFPLTKWWKTSAGVLPYSTVSYESVQTSYDPLTLSDVKNIYAGNGGVAQIYWGNGFNIGKRLALGFNANYLYGNITRAITYEFQGNDSTFCVNSRRQKDTYVNNLVFDLGLQYRQPITPKHTLRFGLTCRLPRDMQLSDHSMVYTYHTAGNQEYLFDTIFPLPGESDTYTSDLQQPFTLGVGLALERNDRWEVSVDGYYAPYSGMKYTENPSASIFGTSSLCYDDNYRIALGGEWKGDDGSGSYWRRIGISAGVYYNSGRLALQATEGIQRMNEMGGGMAFRLPMRRGRSLLTLALGYTSFGELDVLRRDLFTVGISISSCESWFVKRKYD